MRIIPRHEVVAQRARDIAKVCEIVATVGGESVEAGTRNTRNLAADARVLRAIPVIADGVPGTVPNTNPLDEYLRKEALLERHAQSIRLSS